MDLSGHKLQSAILSLGAHMVCRSPGGGGGGAVAVAVAVATLLSDFRSGSQSKDIQMVP